jgi:hypothetical protein
MTVRFFFVSFVSFVSVHSAVLQYSFKNRRLIRLCQIR